MVRKYAENFINRIFSTDLQVLNIPFAISRYK